jgi:hypothetical protein
VARDGPLWDLGTAQWRNAAAYTLLDFSILTLLGANFEHFWVANWTQVTNKNARTLTPGYYFIKCWNIGPKSCKLGAPKFDGILFVFSALGPNTRP